MRGFIKEKNTILDGKQTNEQTKNSKNSHMWRKLWKQYQQNLGWFGEGERRIKVPEMARRSEESFIEVEIPCIEIDFHVFVSTYYLPCWTIRAGFEQAKQMSSVTTCLHREELQEKHLAAHTYLGMPVYAIEYIFYTRPATKF